MCHFICRDGHRHRNQGHWGICPQEIAIITEKFPFVRVVSMGSFAYDKSEGSCPLSLRLLNSIIPMNI